MFQDTTKKIFFSVLIATVAGVGIGFVLSRSSTTVYNAPAAMPSDGAAAEQKPSAPVQNFTVVNNAAEVTAKKVDPKTLTAQSKDIPPPVNFKSFEYDATAGKVISVSGTCSDKFYALVIFKSTVDYRARPDGAVSNRAFDCPSSRTFTLETDLRNYNLQSGGYYFFVADQGSGSWYNPR